MRTMRTRGIARLRSRTMWIAALAVVAVWWTTDLRAQLPLQSVGSPFEMTGFLQSATVQNVNDVFSGGTLTMNNHLVTVPKNTIFQMPATALTWAEMFKFAPAPYAPKFTGLALNDTPKPTITNE